MPPVRLGQGWPPPPELPLPSTGTAHSGQQRPGSGHPAPSQPSTCSAPPRPEPGEGCVRPGPRARLAPGTLGRADLRLPQVSVKTASSQKPGREHWMCGRPAPQLLSFSPTVRAPAARTAPGRPQSGAWNPLWRGGRPGPAASDSGKISWMDRIILVGLQAVPGPGARQLPHLIKP